MEYYNNILCVSKPDLTDGNPEDKNSREWPIMSVEAYKSYVRRTPIVVLRHGGGNERPALLAYDRLRPDLQDKVMAKYCNGQNPYEVVKHNQFKDQLIPDAKAMEYYSSFKLSDGRNLKQDHIREYCANATILNTIKTIVGNRKAMVKSLGGSVNIWDKLSEVVNNLDRNPLTGGYPHTLPSNPRRLKERYKTYLADGYPSLIHRGFCNYNSRKVSAPLEDLILSLYAMPNKPYCASAHDMYLQFLSGILDVVDTKTGELYDRTDFVDPKTNAPLMISESTVWNIINDPKNRVIVDKVRTGSLEFNNTHRPHHHRHSPFCSLSKISMDDRDLPRKMTDGTRVKAYYAYDVTSGCVIGVSYSRLKDKSLFIDCMRDMFRFIDANGFGMPMEVEVEHHLVNKFKDDLMKAGIIFPFVRWCNAGNSQEKRAEHFNRTKKYGYEKTNQEGIGRFYAKLEANRPKYEKVFDEHNDNYKEKTYTFEQLVADDRAIIELYNKGKHRNQKLYPGMSRLDVLKSELNPNLATIDKALLTRYIGNFTQTSIVRSQYVTVQYAKYQLPSPETLDTLEPNNYTVEAYYLYDEKGNIPEVYIYQRGEFIGKCTKIEKYNEATAEQTDADIQSYTEQAKYVKKFDTMVKDRKQKVSKVLTIENKTDYSMVEVETVSALNDETEPPGFNDFMSGYDPDYDTEKALDSL